MSASARSSARPLALPISGLASLGIPAEIHACRRMRACFSCTVSCMHQRELTPSTHACITRLRPECWPSLGIPVEIHACRGAFFSCTMSCMHRRDLTPSPTHARMHHVTPTGVPEFLGSLSISSRPITFFRSTEEGAEGTAHRMTKSRPGVLLGPPLLASGSAAAALRRERGTEHPASPQQRNLPPLPQQGSHVWSSCPRSGAAPAPNPVSLLRFLGVVLAREARVRLPARRPRASGFRTAVAVGQGDTADLPLRQVACRAHASLGNPWPPQADHAR
jgi:hypothetical protein